VVYFVSFDPDWGRAPPQIIENTENTGITGITEITEIE
jgi:hypothetical protein